MALNPLRRRRSLLPWISAALSVLAATTAQAEEAVDRYLGGLGSYVFADSDRAPDSNRGGGVAAYFGQIFENRFGYEFHVSGDGFETGSGQGTDFYRYMLGADLVYNFGDRRSWTPFALVGGGANYNDVFPSDRDGFNFFLNAAVGLVTPPLFETGQIRGRAEARYIYDNFEDRLQDVRVSLGIEVPLFRPARIDFDVPDTAVQVVEVPAGLRDSDGDGVIDERDLCPGTPPGTRVDRHGCPLDAIVELRGVTFELDSARLRPDSETILAYAIDILERYPEMEVEIAGHTCDLGSAAYNQRLSERRAQSVVDYIASQGIESNRLRARGYGEEQPTVPNDSEANRERNRRVEMRILN